MSRLLGFDDGAAHLIGDIRGWEYATAARPEARRVQLAYLDEHRDRMQYAGFAA